MAIFLSAGHNSQSNSIKTDPGAVNSQGVKEGDLTIEFRDMVAAELTNMGIKFFTDLKEESLQMYLDRIKTGDGSVVLEYHFDAATPQATGCTALIEEDADRLDKAFATELASVTSSILGIANRGVKPESYTRHKRLALMKETGIICLMELGFITNPSDLSKYHTHKCQLARVHAELLIKYEKIIP